MASGKRSRGDEPLGLFERVEGFGATGASGTIVAVSSNTVTVQLDAGALRVVVARVGSGATFVSPAIPAADPAGSAAVMPVPGFGHLERGSSNCASRKASSFL
ncbi:hypothetical protein M885DRAFT_580700 [Pelagophyceae sp. CCMP2097]|nr:hypothetical protein M885DRAFT_580700 [Pelagophyceae sp. CCMP2097]